MLPYPHSYIDKHSKGQDLARNIDGGVLSGQYSLPLFFPCLMVKGWIILLSPRLSYLWRVTNHKVFNYLQDKIACSCWTDGVCQNIKNNSSARDTVSIAHICSSEHEQSPLPT